MTVIVQNGKKARLPGYLVYPVARSALEQAFNNLPQETIILNFWATNLKQPSPRKENSSYNWLLGAQNSGDNWQIDVYARYSDKIAEIRSALIEYGLPRMRDWFIKADRSNSPSKPEYISYKGWRSFWISFDGE